MSRDLTEAEARALEAMERVEGKPQQLQRLPFNPLATTLAPDQPGSLREQLAKAAVPRVRPSERMRHLIALERLLLEMADDDEREDALRYHARGLGFDLVRINRCVPGTSIPEGAFPP